MQRQGERAMSIAKAIAARFIARAWRKPTRLLLALLLSLASLFAPALAQQPEAEGAHQEILEILHGEPRGDVVPTPELCKQVGNGRQDASKFTSVQWYLDGAGDCRVTYKPEIRQLFSPMADKGNVSQFMFDPRKTQRLIMLLERLSALDSAHRFSVQQKFDLQMTLWEMITALQDRRTFSLAWEPPLDQKVVDHILTAALGLLSATLLTQAEIDALPDTLAQLPQLSGVPAIDATVSRLLHGDENWLELVSPGQVHLAFAIGRVYGRIFLTSDDPQQLNLLKDNLKAKETVSLRGFSWATDKPGDEKAKGFKSAQPELVDLPQRIGSMHAILVLYFQALDKDFRPVPTHLLAGWREVWFTGKINKTADMAGDDPQFHFRTIDYKKNLDSPLQQQEFHPIYEQLSEFKISRSNFLDVNPTYPKTSVTTLRAACLSCHANRIKTFDYRGNQGFIGFTPPQREADSRLTDTPFGQRLSKRFKEWSQQFVNHTKDERHNTAKP